MLRFPCSASQQGNMKLGGSRVRTAELAKGILHSTEYHIQCINCVALAVRGQSAQGWAGLVSGWWAMLRRLSLLDLISVSAFFFTIIIIGKTIFYFVSIMKLVLPQPRRFTCFLIFPMLREGECRGVSTVWYLIGIWGKVLPEQLCMDKGSCCKSRNCI